MPAAATRPGQMRDRVTIQRATRAADAFGQLVETWSTVATRRADIRPTSGVERVVAEQLRAIATHVVILRDRTDIRPTDRLLTPDGTKLAILQAVNTDGVRRFLTLVCKSLEDASTAAGG